MSTFDFLDMAVAIEIIQCSGDEKATAVSSRRLLTGINILASKLKQGEAAANKKAEIVMGIQGGVIRAETLTRGAAREGVWREGTRQQAGTGRAGSPAFPKAGR